MFCMFYVYKCNVHVLYCIQLVCEIWTWKSPEVTLSGWLGYKFYKPTINNLPGPTGLVLFFPFSLHCSSPSFLWSSILSPIYHLASVWEQSWVLLSGAFSRPSSQRWELVRECPYSLCSWAMQSVRECPYSLCSWAMQSEVGRSIHCRLWHLISSVMDCVAVLLWSSALDKLTLDQGVKNVIDYVGFFSQSMFVQNLVVDCVLLEMLTFEWSNLC